MTTAIKRRRGTTTQHATFTGLEGELTVDTTKDTVVVHDGSTAGGFPLAKESQATTNVAITGGSITGITDLAVADGGTGASTAGDARTNLGVTATGADTTYAFRANNLSDLASASTARANLGLGSIVTLDSNNVAFTGGSINGTTIGATTANTGAFTTLGATGVATFSAGTVSAPAITTTGDTNTGIFFPAADTIAFTEGGVESMRLDSNGSLGVGVTPQTWTLGKSVSVGDVGSAVFGFGGYNALTSGSYFNSGWKYSSSSSSQKPALINISDGEFVFSNAVAGTAGNAISFSERMRIPATGGLQVVNCVSVGNATPAASGTGITFPATQSASSDANTLDDYEEGTFTPTWTPATGSGATVNTANGYYTKVGNMVTVVFRLGTNGHGTSSGDITIGGLPFVVSSLSNNLSVFCAGQSANMAITAGQNLVGQNINGTTNINPVLWKVATGTQTITAAEWGVSGVVWFSGSYFV